MKDLATTAPVSFMVRVKDGSFQFAGVSPKTIIIPKQFRLESINCFRDDILIATFGLYVPDDTWASSVEFHVEPGIFDGRTKGGPAAAHGFRLDFDLFQEGDLLIVKVYTPAPASTPSEVWSGITET